MGSGCRVLADVDRWAPQAMGWSPPCDAFRFGSEEGYFLIFADLGEGVGQDRVHGYQTLTSSRPRAMMLIAVGTSRRWSSAASRLPACSPTAQARPRSPGPWASQ